MKKFLTVSIYITAANSTILRRNVRIDTAPISTSCFTEITWPPLLLASAHRELLLMVAPCSCLYNLLLFLVLVAHVKCFSCSASRWHQPARRLLLWQLLLLEIKSSSKRLLLLLCYRLPTSCILVNGLRINSAVWMESLILIFILRTLFRRIGVKVIRSCCKLWSPRASISIWGRWTWYGSRYHWRIIRINLLFLDRLILLVVKVAEWPRLNLSDASSITHSLLLLVSITVEKSSTSIMSHKSYISSSIYRVNSSRTSHSDYLVLTDSITAIDHSWRDARFIRISKFAVKLIRLIHCNQASCILFLTIVLAKVL